MRKLYFIFLFLLSFGTLSAQDITIYGFLPSGNPDTEFLRLGHLDAMTGNVFAEDSIYPVNAYALGSSSFDAVNNAFMFIGVDTNFTFRLYSYSIRIDTTLYDPVYGATINDVQNDMNSMGTYGLGNYKSDSVLIDSINNLWQYEYATRFLKIDQQEGTITELTQMPDISAFPVGSSTFDANNGRYIVNAYDNSFKERLLVIEAETGTILSDELTGLQPGDFLNNLEYNNEDDKVYGLYRGSGNTFTAVVSLDLNNENQIDTVYVFEDLKYFVQGSAVFHQASQSYIMYYIDENNNNRLAVIDITTGTRIGNAQISEYLTEIEVDNTEYAIAKYHETVSVDEDVKESSFVLFPNPIVSNGILKINTTENPESIRIYDINGKLWKSIEGSTDNQVQIVLNNLPTGLYVVSLSIDGSIKTEKLLVR